MYVWETVVGKGFFLFINLLTKYFSDVFFSPTSLPHILTYNMQTVCRSPHPACSSWSPDSDWENPAEVGMSDTGLSWQLPRRPRWVQSRRVKTHQYVSPCQADELTHTLGRWVTRNKGIRWVLMCWKTGGIAKENKREGRCAGDDREQQKQIIMFRLVKWLIIMDRYTEGYPVDCVWNKSLTMLHKEFN